jgi:hypothetical protein
MGRIVDRSKEHLSETDAAIIATRRLLLRLLRNPNAVPPGIAPTYYKMRATEKIIETGCNWGDMMTRFLEPNDLREAQAAAQKAPRKRGAAPEPKSRATAAPSNPLPRRN